MIQYMVMLLCGFIEISIASLSVSSVQLFSSCGCCFQIYMILYVDQLASLDTVSSSRTIQVLLQPPGWFTIRSTILTFLTPGHGHLLLRSCLVLIVDRHKLILNAAAIKLASPGSTFSVPTPPLQPYIYLGQVGDIQRCWSSAAGSEPLRLCTFYLKSQVVEEVVLFSQWWSYTS